MADLKDALLRVKNPALALVGIWLALAAIGAFPVFSSSGPSLRFASTFILSPIILLYAGYVSSKPNGGFASGAIGGFLAGFAGSAAIFMLSLATMALRAYAYVLQGAVSPALGWVFLIIGAQALFPSVLAYSLAGAILGAFGALLSQKMK